MKRSVLAAFAALALAASARVTPISEGRLYTDLDANGHTITNLPAGFFPTNTYTKAETDARIVELAPAPGNYASVSNAAMNAVTTNAAGLLTTSELRFVDGTISASTPGIYIQTELGNWLFPNMDCFRSNGDCVMRRQDLAAATNGFFSVDRNVEASDLMYGVMKDDGVYKWTLGFPNYGVNVFYWLPDCTEGSDDTQIPDEWGYDVYLASRGYVDNAISKNNAAFVEAVLAAPLTGASAGDLAEIGEYGSYGTIGAAILALIAGLAALKRRIGTAETAISGLAPKYPMVPVTPSNGTLTVSPYTVATYTAGDSAAAFTVAVGTGETGKARDCELVIDCTATDAVAPTVTWPATFHPRTDAATDFACEAGKRNVYFISEYASGEFAVGGWQETAGGNA